MAAVPQRVEAQAGASHSVWLRAAPDSGEVYLSWSSLYPGPYSVRWRRAGGSEWREARSNDAFYVISELTNGERHEFQVEAESHGVRLPSPVVQEEPRVRVGCEVRVFVFCSRHRFLQFIDSAQGPAEDMLCGSRAIGRRDPQLPNCRYRVNGHLADLNRYVDEQFVPPAALPETHLLRRILRRTLWHRYDASAGGAPPRLLEVPHADAGAVTGFAAVRRFILRDPPPGLQSRITCFDPLVPVEGRSAVYIEGHDASAVTDGPALPTWLLERGWQVCAVDMPMEGTNVRDRTMLRVGHDDLVRTTADDLIHKTWDDGALLGEFLAPIWATVDWMVGRAGDSPGPASLVVAGRSGGGLLACLYGALDARVDVVVDIAGCYPMSTLMESAPFDTAGKPANHLEYAYIPLADQVPDIAWFLAGGTRANLHFYSTRDPCCGRYGPDHPWTAYLRARGASDRRVHVSVSAEPAHGLTLAGLAELERLLNDALRTERDGSRDAP